MVGIRVDGAADTIDKFKRVHRLTIDEALQVDVVEAVLCLQALGHSLGNRLNNDNRGVEVRPLIHLPYYPVDESAKEVALAKLYDSLGTLRLLSCGAVEFLHILSLLRYNVISLLR